MATVSTENFETQKTSVKRMAAFRLITQLQLSLGKDTTNTSSGTGLGIARALVSQQGVRFFKCIGFSKNNSRTNIKYGLHCIILEQLKY